MPWTRNERSAVAGAKTTSYAENVVALAHAHARGAHEAIFANTRGELCEGTGSNIFVGVDGALRDPAAVVRLPRRHHPRAAPGVGGQGGAAGRGTRPAARGPAAAEDVVLTSSTRDVQRVAVVDGRELRGGETGTAAAELFARRAADGVDP